MFECEERKSFTKETKVSILSFEGDWVNGIINRVYTSDLVKVEYKSKDGHRYFERVVDRFSTREIKSNPRWKKMREKLGQYCIIEFYDQICKTWRSGYIHSFTKNNQFKINNGKVFDRWSRNIRICEKWSNLTELCSVYIFNCHTMRWHQGIISAVIKAENDKSMDIFEIIYKDNDNYYIKHVHQFSALLIPEKHLELNSVDFMTEVTTPDLVDIYSKNMLLQVHTLTNILCSGYIKNK